MSVEHLTLRNIRCLRELDLPVTDEDGRPRKWTLLLGENGAGKSTVLRAMERYVHYCNVGIEMLAIRCTS